jgi:hypothetical protein
MYLVTKEEKNLIDNSAYYVNMASFDTLGKARAYAEECTTGDGLTYHVWALKSHCTRVTNVTWTECNGNGNGGAS